MAANQDKQEQTAADHHLKGTADHAFKIQSKYALLGVSEQNLQLCLILQKRMRARTHTRRIPERLCRYKC